MEKPLDPLYKKLGPDYGVQVTQVDKIHYKITFKSKTVDDESGASFSFSATRQRKLFCIR